MPCNGDVTPLSDEEEDGFVKEVPLFSFAYESVSFGFHDEGLALGFSIYSLSFTTEKLPSL